MFSYRSFSTNYYSSSLYFLSMFVNVSKIKLCFSFFFFYSSLANLSIYFIRFFSSGLNYDLCFLLSFPLLLTSFKAFFTYCSCSSSKFSYFRVFSLFFRIYSIIFIRLPSRSASEYTLFCFMNGFYCSEIVNRPSSIYSIIFKAISFEGYLFLFDSLMINLGLDELLYYFIFVFIINIKLSYKLSSSIECIYQSFKNTGNNNYIRLTVACRAPTNIIMISHTQLHLKT